MRLGIIAGNRLLPLILAKAIKEKEKIELTAICFKGETNPHIAKYVDKKYWIEAGKLGLLKEIIKKEEIKQWIMAGQISPLRIFKRNRWDKDLSGLVERIGDLRPHTIFKEIIRYLETEGITFLDSTLYLKSSLADDGIMSVAPDSEAGSDIDFGLDVISRFAELDIGQSIVCKKRSVVAIEALEGTDRTIARAYRLAKRGCTVLKFSKINQDLRFDVPVVGISTLKLLKKIRAASLVLEKDRVIILQKPLFLSLAKMWKIPVVGKEKIER